jgi:hypothetical protein
MVVLYHVGHFTTDCYALHESGVVGIRSEIVPYNLRFPGQYFMAETGLNQNMQRDYDPLTDRR